MWNGCLIRNKQECFQSENYVFLKYWLKHQKYKIYMEYMKKRMINLQNNKDKCNLIAYIEIIFCFEESEVFC